MLNSSPMDSGELEEVRKNTQATYEKKQALGFRDTKSLRVFLPIPGPPARVFDPPRIAHDGSSLVPLNFV